MPPLHSHASRYDRPLCGPLRTPARETICSRLAKSFLQLRSSFDRQRMFPAAVCAGSLFGNSIPSHCRSRMSSLSNWANAPITLRSRFAIRESSPVKVRHSFIN